MYKEFESVIQNEDKLNRTLYTQKINQMLQRSEKGENKLYIMIQQYLQNIREDYLFQISNRLHQQKILITFEYTKSNLNYLQDFFFIFNSIKKNGWLQLIDIDIIHQYLKINNIQILLEQPIGHMEISPLYETGILCFSQILEFVYNFYIKRPLFHKPNININNLELTSPFYRIMLRRKNLTDDDINAQFYQPDFSIKQFIFFCIDNFFPSSSLLWIQNNTQIHIIILKMILKLCQYGLFEHNELENLTFLIQQCSQSLKYFEIHFQRNSQEMKEDNKIKKQQIQNNCQKARFIISKIIIHIQIYNMDEKLKYALQTFKSYNNENLNININISSEKYKKIHNNLQRNNQKLKIIDAFNDMPKEYTKKEIFKNVSSQDQSIQFTISEIITQYLVIEPKISLIYDQQLKKHIEKITKRILNQFSNFNHNWFYLSIENIQKQSFQFFYYHERIFQNNTFCVLIFEIQNQLNDLINSYIYDNGEQKTQLQKFYELLNFVNYIFELIQENIQVVVAFQLGFQLFNIQQQLLQLYKIINFVQKKDNVYQNFTQSLIQTMLYMNSQSNPITRVQFTNINSSQFLHDSLFSQYFLDLIEECKERNIYNISKFYCNRSVFYVKRLNNKIFKIMSNLLKNELPQIKSLLQSIDINNLKLQLKDLQQMFILNCLINFLLHQIKYQKVVNIKFLLSIQEIMIDFYNVFFAFFKTFQEKQYNNSVQNTLVDKHISYFYEIFQTDEKVFTEDDKICLLQKMLKLVLKLIYNTVRHCYGKKNQELLYKCLNEYFTLKECQKIGHNKSQQQIFKYIIIIHERVSALKNNNLLQPKLDTDVSEQQQEEGYIDSIPNNEVDFLSDFIELMTQLFQTEDNTPFYQNKMLVKVYLPAIYRILFGIFITMNQFQTEKLQRINIIIGQLNTFFDQSQAKGELIFKQSCLLEDDILEQPLFIRKYLKNNIYIIRPFLLLNPQLAKLQKRLSKAFIFIFNLYINYNKKMFTKLIETQQMASQQSYGSYYDSFYSAQGNEYTRNDLPREHRVIGRVFELSDKFREQYNIKNSKIKWPLTCYQIQMADNEYYMTCKQNKIIKLENSSHDRQYLNLINDFKDPLMQLKIFLCRKYKYFQLKQNEQSDENQFILVAENRDQLNSNYANLVEYFIKQIHIYYEKVKVNESAMFTDDGFYQLVLLMDNLMRQTEVYREAFYNSCYNSEDKNVGIQNYKEQFEHGQQGKGVRYREIPPEASALEQWVYELFTIQEKLVSFLTKKIFQDNVWEEVYHSFYIISNFIQNLCEDNYYQFKNHFTCMQMSGTQKTYLLHVQEMIERLIEGSELTSNTESTIDPTDKESNFLVLNRLFECLTEFINGGKSIAVYVLFDKMSQFISSIITRSIDDPSSEFYFLQLNCINYVMSLLECNMIFPRRQLGFTIPVQKLFNSITQNITQLYKKKYVHYQQKKSKRSDLLKEAESFSYDDLLYFYKKHKKNFSNHIIIDNAINIVNFITIMSESITKYKNYKDEFDELVTHGSNLPNDLYKKVQIWRFLDKITIELEVVIEPLEGQKQGELDVKCFKRNQESFFLTRAEKDDFRQRAKITSIQVKHEEFYGNVKALLISMQTQRNYYKKSTLWFYLQHDDQTRQYVFLLYFLAIIINVLIIIYNSSESSIIYLSSPIPKIIFIITIIQDILSIFVLYIFLKYKLPVLLKKGKIGILDMGGKIQRIKIKAMILAQSLIMSEIFILPLTYFLLNIFGLAFSSFFFTLQLSLVITLVPLFMGIIRAFVGNIRKIIVTLTIIVMIINFFSLITYEQLREYMSDDFKSACSSYISCIINQTLYGFTAQGGVGDLLKQSYKLENDLFGFRFFFDMIFWFLIAIFLLGMFFGIIVDSFTEFRENRDEREMDQENICFVCGLQRKDFEIRQLNFEQHLSYHSIWKYLYYIQYLKNVSVSEHDGIDDFVYDQLKEEKTENWMPIDRTIILDDFGTTK